MYIDRHSSCCIPSVINYRCELYMHHVSLLALCIYCYCSYCGSFASLYVSVCCVLPNNYGTRPVCVQQYQGMGYILVGMHYITKIANRDNTTMDTMDTVQGRREQQAS